MISAEFVLLLVLRVRDIKPPRTLPLPGCQIFDEDVSRAFLVQTGALL